MKHAPKYTIKVDTGLITIIELKKKYCSVQIFNTVKFQVVDWSTGSTIQFWALFAKGQRTRASKFPFINSLKILASATIQDRLLLATLRCIIQK